MASFCNQGALIAKQVWVGCPVLRTWAHAFVSETSTAQESSSCCTQGWGCWGHHCGTEMVPRSLLDKHGFNRRAPRPKRGVNTLCEAGGEAARAGDAHRMWLPITPGTQQQDFVEHLV